VPDVGVNMPEDEFVVIEMKIRKTAFGSESNQKLRGVHFTQGAHELTDEFKDMLWDDYSLDIDELLKEFGDREDSGNLLV
jgi:hypothetical protein